MTRSRSLRAEHTLLAQLREQDQIARTAEANKLALAAEWAEAHPVDSPEDAATFGDSPITIAGDGCPMVSEFAVVELATILGMGQVAGRHYVGQALELKHRLPRCWDRVMSGDVPAWRARRLAEQTTQLTVEAAAYVDAQVAGFLHSLGIRAQERLVEEAVNRFMPEHAAAQRAAAAETRHFTIDRDQVTWAGTVALSGELDLADAYDLDTAITGGAEQQHRLGSTDPLDVRRAKAAGDLARTQLALGFDFTLTEQTSADGQTNTAEIVEGFGGSLRSHLNQPAGGRVAAEERGGRTETPPAPGRQAVLYLHLHPDGHGVLENRGGPHLLTPGTVKEWLQVPGTTVTIRPVIDLHDEQCTTSYTPTERIREQVILTDGTCVFPHCARPARRADLDHIDPYDQGGPTSTTNLACLCRLHHRTKTFAEWSYQRLSPGVYEWTGPHGHRFRVDRTGTTPLPDK